MEQLINTKKEHPDYKVYVTGHRYVHMFLLMSSFIFPFFGVLFAGSYIDFLMHVDTILSLLSLGGSLATLFAFYASTPKYWSNFSPYPVTCISLASPLVGDYNWRCAFMLQG
jgi:hypothetical protein